MVDVLLRVRGDMQAARRCRASVFASSNRTPFDVIVVAFAGVDGEVDTLERERDRRITIVRSTQPSSDQAALDRALALHRDRDVVLLDADAEVHGDWLDRVASHAHAEGVGAVATFANAGRGATYPRMDAANAVPAGYTDATLDALFARANHQRSADVDVAAGPCRYVMRAAITALGSAPIGAGDDAEVERDWSRRAASAGFRSRVAGDVFVHCGDASRRRGNDHAHPGADAVLPLACRVDLARLAASPLPTIVFVAHAWGGGVRRHMNDLARLTRERANVLYLEPANDGAVKLHWPCDGESFAAYFRLPADLAVLAGMLHAIGVARLHFHHVHGLPPSILDLPRTAGIAYDCTLHDYFAICPQYHLTDRQGRYCGEPAAAGCAACLDARPPQWPLDIAAWRALFGEFLRGAERVIAPSHDVETRIHRYFPALPIVVWPHPEAAAQSLPPPIRIVTLGNLSNEKGLRVVAECASDAKRRALPLAFRVLGATADPMVQAPDAPLTVHDTPHSAPLIRAA